jgi:hypothetical protein
VIGHDKVSAATGGGRNSVIQTGELPTETVMAFPPAQPCAILFTHPPPIALQSITRDVRFSHDGLASLHDRQSAFKV